MSINLKDISNLPIVEITQYRLSRRLSDKKPIECYECLHNSGVDNCLIIIQDENGSNKVQMQSSSPVVYTVRIVYFDGEENIETGDLNYFNENFEIIEIKGWKK